MSLYDAIEIGSKVQLGDHTFGTDSIKRFATKFDPQPFHLDEEAAKASVFGGLCASGWHTLSVWMNLNVKNGFPGLIEGANYLGPLPRFGPGLGVGPIHWYAPVFSGDTLSYVNEVSNKRHLASKPGWGIITLKSTATNQHGKLVLDKVGSAMMGLE